jgi:excisionase family DNA binding protein
MENVYNGTMEEEYLTVKEFAAKIRVHYNTVLRSIRCGRLNAVRIGYGKKAAFRIAKSEIQRISLCDMEYFVSQIIEEKIRNKL